MSLTNFFKNYSKAKSEQIGEGLVNLAAALDASGVSEAAIKQKQEEHAEYVKQLVDAQTEFKREKREFDDIVALYNRKLAAAERAQSDLAANPNNTDAAAALAELLESVEKIAPRLEREKQEYEASERLMNELQQAADDVAKELLGLRQQINETKAAIKEAEVAAERERKNKEKAEKLAGLRSATNKFDTAMNALQRQAEEKQKEAAANRIAAEQLRKPADAPSAAASKYLDEATPAAPTEDLQTKLARLKSKVN